MTMYADPAFPVDRSTDERPRAGVPGNAGPADVDRPRPLAGTLHVLDGPDRGQVWRLRPGAYLLGRADDCDLPMTDQEVSRWHCMVGVTSEAGRTVTVTVEDLGSSNGTAVDGARVDYPTVLAPGATIVVGRTTLGWAPAGWHPSASRSTVHVPPMVVDPPVPVRMSPMAAVAPPPEPFPMPGLVPIPAVAPVPAVVPVSVAHSRADAPAAPASPPVHTTEPLPRKAWWPRSAAPARPAPSSAVLPTLTSLVALGTLAAIGTVAHLPLLIPPLAASMALIAAGTALPLAQPRNVIGGQVVSALVGFAVIGLIGPGGWAAALAGGIALGAMLVLRVSHSPAAATAVIVGATGPSAARFLELLVLAAVILVAFGIIGARADGKTYPVYWW
jgi:hypothetical protein